MNKKTILIAGGGTGGHIYPAISIADAIKKMKPDIRIIFVGTKAGLEKKIIPRAGHEIIFIDSGKFNLEKQYLKKIITLGKVLIGIFQSIHYIIKYRPNFILGVGGYASAPMLLAAGLMKKKSALWEPNALPGMANRILSRLISKAYLVYDDAKLKLKSKEFLTYGMPLRSEIFLKNKSLPKTQPEAQSKNSERFTLLCFGGSQGSLFLNDKLSEYIISVPHLHHQIKIFHQTGPQDYERVKSKYKNHNIDEKTVEVFDYIYDMPNYYNQSDVMLCRGGASTLAEASAFQVVPIIIPLPAADNHQQKNAEAIVKNQAGFMILQNCYELKNLSDILSSLMNNQILLQQKKKNLSEISNQNAAELIAKDIIESLSN